MPRFCEAQFRHAAHYLQIVIDTNKLYIQGGEAMNLGLAIFDAEWLNIQAGQSWATQAAINDDTGAALCSDYPFAGAYILNLRQHPQESIRWLEAGLAAARQLNDWAAEGRHLGNL